MEHYPDYESGFEQDQNEGMQSKYALALSKYNTHLHDDEVQIKVDNLINKHLDENNNLEVKNLSFSYDEQTKVLSDICMQARKGEIVGIVGESGCGKSTLLKLLLRFWQKSTGELLYNGMDIENVDSESLLKNVTMVSQVTYLFDETIEENLRIAKPDATMEEIVAAAKASHAHSFIRRLPKSPFTAP